MYGLNLSTVRITDAKTIEIHNSDGEKRKFILDGKEVDLSKIQRIDISFDCNGINLKACIAGGSLPIKE